DALQHVSTGKDTELHFVGAVGDCGDIFDLFAEYLGTSIFLHGLRKRPEVVRAMQDADILVNISNQSMHQLPSKVVEYVWTGKPLLNLTTVAKDTTSEFLAAYPGLLSLVVSDGKPTNLDVAALRDFVATPPATVPVEARKQWLAAYEIDAIAGQYDALMAVDRPVGCTAATGE
ncbi:MAG: hypothetical protein KKA42_15480, partial [candidate division Zixibacteria bacterium]|nr:hypothetical protein [candidate division Zixibacteria bacterium]